MVESPPSSLGARPRASSLCRLSPLPRSLLFVARRAAGSPSSPCGLPSLPTRDAVDDVFYNLLEKRYYRLSFPKKEYYVKISNYGWFYTDYEITNLFTRSQIPVPSPPERDLLWSLNWGDLLSVPTDSDCVLLSNFIDLDGTFFQSFYRFGDRTWTRLESSININVICGGKFYGLLHDEKNLTEVEPFPAPVVRYLDMSMAEDLVLSKDPDRFLVECEGHILLVQINKTLQDRDIYYKVKVLRADLSRKRWVRIESLGNNMLFLSKSTKTSSFSMSVADTGGPGNHIYFWGKKEKMLIEYDYQSHHVVHRKIPHLMEPDWVVGGFFLAWMVPSLW